MKKKLAIVLAVALLASCSQTKDVTKQSPLPKSSQETADKSEKSQSTIIKTTDSNYSVFNKVGLDEFKASFESKYEDLYKSMSDGGKIPKTPLVEPQTNDMLYDFPLSPYLVLSCVVNDDGTMGMAVLMKLTPAQDPNYNDGMVNKQFAILKQALITATAPGATREDVDAVKNGLPVPKPMTEGTSFIYKGISYMANIDTEDPAVSKEMFMTTFE